MPVLAQINLDGNCFLIMLIALAFVFMTGTNVSWLNLAGIATLVLFLSFGAPNQPGSILIATLIITSYLHSYEMMCVAIYAEALFGSSLNIANVIGDVVSVAIGEQAYTKE
jgi:Na+/H+-dicarboxylate symporter